MGRRAWLQGLGAAGAALAAPLVLPWGTRGAGAASPGNKLNIAAIGAGDRCSFLIEEVLRQGNNIVALCDVDRAQLDRSRKLVADVDQRCKTPPRAVHVYEDYRKLLEAEKTLDAVLVATGSRWHAPISAACMKAGKHVYCEKPLVHKIAEARELIELASQCKVVTQYGTHGGSGKAFRRSIEIIQAGLLGQVREVHMWCDGYGKNPPSHDRPPGEDPLPAGLNWDFWLGPAPLRPFKRGVYHPGCLAFQNWFDLCNGMLAGQGAHTFYLPVRALKLGYPVRVEAEIPEPVKETYVSKGSFRFDFAARGDLAPVRVWWMDGGKYPPAHVTEGLKAMSGKAPNMGCLFLGEKGDLYAGGWGESGVMRLQGDKQWRGVLDHDAARPLPLTLPRAPGDNHMAEWLRACQGGPPTFTGFEVGAHVAEVYLPGILALRLGRPIEWDGAAMKAAGLPQADPLIQKNYRSQWML
jgi:predicted dehydrogenase